MPVFPQSLVARLARKELREILRDRRTIVTLVLMPILLYPLMSIAFYQYFLSTAIPEKTTEYTLAFPSNAEGMRFIQFLNRVKRKDDPKLDLSTSDDVTASVRTGAVDV